MKKSFVLAALCVALLSGCVAPPPVPPYSSLPDPSDPGAPQGEAGPLRPNLVATTKVYLDPSAGADAQKMEHGNMQGMDGMQMDHSKMPGMEPKQAPATTPAQSQQMDHSKMPGMDAAQPSASPPSKEALETEMKKTSEEMKKTSDELKAKAEEAKKREKRTRSPAPKPSATTEIYTCPMHPEVKSDNPGKCPKCGMTLVLKSAK